MNWSIVAILVTVGLAQAGLVVALLDRLFKAEIKVLSKSIDMLQAELSRRDSADDDRDDEIADLKSRVQRIEDRMESNGCSRPGRQGCAE